MVGGGKGATHHPPGWRVSPLIGNSRPGIQLIVQSAVVVVVVIGPYQSWLVSLFSSVSLFDGGRCLRRRATSGSDPELPNRNQFDGCR